MGCKGVLRSRLCLAESLKRDREEKAENKCIGCHLRVYERREQKPDGGGTFLPAKKRGDGQHGERSRERAGCQVIVGDGEGGSGYGYGQQCGEQSDGRPSSTNVLETERSKLPSCDENQEDAANVPEEDREVGGKV